MAEDFPLAGSRVAIAPSAAAGPSVKAQVRKHLIIAACNPDMDVALDNRLQSNTKLVWCFIAHERIIDLESALTIKTWMVPAIGPNAYQPNL